MAIQGVWESLSAVDVASLDEAAAAAHLFEVQAHAAQVEKRRVEAAAQLQRVGSLPPEEVIRQPGSGVSSRDAQRLAGRARVVSDQPGLADAGSAVLDAVARHASAFESGDQRREFLVEAAKIAERAHTPESVERQLAPMASRIREDSGMERLECQRSEVKAFRGVNEATGMFWLRAEFDPETGAEVFAKWDAQIKRVAKREDGRHGPHAAGIALGELIARSTDGSRSATRNEMILVVDSQALSDHSDGLCETIDGQPLPAEVAWRRSCLC